eukprot:TRINITY_DN889_c0_g1_i4.p1 TRINITY_DN889_c0_g1~~TRINITY_DN889_c0_g1_i4.p1  ORF type:complete len:518 (+),score=97.52 TRINITY_DN889_c0_g1_i4:186-1739(+)
MSFPGAIGLCIEFDKRCKCDNQTDFLVIQAWYDSHQQHSNYYMSTRDSLGQNYRITGKPYSKKPLFILGNNVQIDFTSSGQAKDDQSLMRWGFKINIKPVFGIKNAFHILLPSNSSIDSLIQRFGNENEIKSWITTLMTLLVPLENLLSQCLEGEKTQLNEISNNKLLEWTIFKNGLKQFNLQNCLASINKKQLQKVKKNMTQQFGDLNIEQIIESNSEHFEQSSITSQQLLEIISPLGISQVQQQQEKSSVSQKKRLLKTASLQKENQGLLKFKQLLHNLNGDKSVESEKLKSNSEEKPKSQKILKIEQIDWNSLDKHMRAIVQQVKNQSGELNTLIEQVKSQKPQLCQLKIEKMRPTFSKQNQQYWDLAESIIILVCLYHLGILQTNVASQFELAKVKFFKDQLDEICSLKNSILRQMISEVQQEREWQQCLKDLQEIYLKNLKEKEMKIEAKEKEKEEVKEQQPKKEIEEQKVIPKKQRKVTVSYTHLTLPTKRIVQISLGAVSPNNQMISRQP